MKQAAYITHNVSGAEAEIGSAYHTLYLDAAKAANKAMLELAELSSQYDHQAELLFDAQRQLRQIENLLTTESCGSTANRTRVELSQLRK